MKDCALSHQRSHTLSAKDCRVPTLKSLNVSVGAVATEVILGMLIFIREIEVFLCSAGIFILIISTFIDILKAENCRNKRQVLHKQVRHLVLKARFIKLWVVGGSRSTVREVAELKTI
jgi:hypothetical protein